MKKISLLGVICACLSFSSPTFAGSKYWVCSNDFWDASCWSSSSGGSAGAGQPLTGDFVWLSQSDSINRIITYQNTFNPTDALQQLFVDATGTGIITLSQYKDEINIIGGAFIGKDGQGAVNLTGGTFNSPGGVQLGDSSTGNGTFAISNTGVLSAGNLSIGSSGTGALNISNGGTVSSSSAGIAVGTGSNGTATISGAGSSLTITNSLNVGLNGAGSLNINNGGVLSTSGLGDNIIGWQSGSNGTVTVSGDGSDWTNTNSSITIGGSSTGDLTIDNGGSVSTKAMKVGWQTGSNGTVMVSGTDSTLTTTSGLTVGSGGTGVLTVQDNGSVTVGGNLGMLNAGTVNLDGGSITTGGFNSQGTFNFTDGTLTVDGGTYNDGQTNLFVDGATASDSPELQLINGGSASYTGGAVVIGNVNNGSLLIQDGGSVSSGNSILANNSGGGSSGTATVTGAGSTWTNNTELDVGRWGSGMLNIEAGGSVSNQFGVLGGQSGGSGIATVTGAGSTWTNSSSFAVGSSGTGTLTIEAGGLVSSNVGYVGRASGGSGTATITGVGSNWTNNSDLIVGYFGTAGVLNIDSGGGVSNQRGFIGYNAGTNGTVTVSDSGSVWSNSSSVYIGGSNTAAGGTGVLNIQNNGLVTVGGDMTVWNTGTVNLNGGNLTVTGTYTTSGDTVVNGNLNANAVEVLDGKVTGNGTIIGDLMNKGGKVNPGNSPGDLTIDGNYTQEVGAELIIEVAGTSAGQFDVLNILGTATFDTGTSISLDFIGGFAPSTDDVFDFLLADIFASDMNLVDIIILGLEPEFDFDVGFTETGTFGMVALNDGVSAVPVPGAVWLFGSGLIGLVGMARRKKAA